MGEIIALKLIATLTGFLFEGYLDTFKTVEIEGAPSWYQKSSGSQILLGYGYESGGIKSIDIAKDNCKKDLINKINKSVQISIEDNFKHIKNPKEKEIVRLFATDSNLQIFVDKNLKFEKIEHTEDQEKGIFQKKQTAQTFVGCAVSKQSIVDYEKERLLAISKAVINFKSEKAIEELEPGVR